MVLKQIPKLIFLDELVLEDFVMVTITSEREREREPSSDNRNKYDWLTNISPSYKKK